MLERDSTVTANDELTIDSKVALEATNKARPQNQQMFLKPHSKH